MRFKQTILAASARRISGLYVARVELSKRRGPQELHIFSDRMPTEETAVTSLAINLCQQFKTRIPEASAYRIHRGLWFIQIGYRP